MLLLVAVLAVVGAGSGVAASNVRHESEGLCPNITEKQDLDPVPYLGRWYEIERFSMIWEFEMDCVNAIYSDLGEGVVEVHNTARTLSGEFTDIIGTATVIAPGVLLVQFPGHVAAEYHVLDTDYETFSAVYNCVQEETMNSREQMVEILLHDAYSEILASTKAKQAVFWALTVASFMKVKSVQISGRWENVLWKIVILSKNWMPQYTVDFSELVYDTLRPWILRMFSIHKMCPNPHLRLEMLRFIGMWPESYLQDATAGQQAAAGLVDTSPYLVMNNLISSDSQISLLSHLKKVVNILRKYGHLDAVAAASVTQVRNLEVGKETAFFNHLIQLLSQMAEAIRDMYFAGHIDALQTTVEFHNIFYLFDLLVLMPPTITTYQSPGLAQSAAASLVNMTSALDAMGPKLQLEAPDCFLMHFSNLDELLQMVRKSTPISTVLGLSHAQILASINQRAAESGFSFPNFKPPCEELTEESPEEFVDSVTFAVMEAPVLLHSSKMVVDESTLVQLLLNDPTDPFTRVPLDHGSYSRLSDHQDDINARRNAKTAIQVHASVDNNIVSESESDISDVDVIIDSINDSEIDKSACSLQILLSQFGFN